MRDVKQTVVDKGRDDLRFGPLSFGIVLFSEPVPTVVIRNGYLRKVVFQNSLMEVNDKLEEEGSKW